MHIIEKLQKGSRFITHEQMQYKNPCILIGEDDYNEYKKYYNFLSNKSSGFIIEKLSFNTLPLLVAKDFDQIILIDVDLESVRLKKIKEIFKDDEWF